MVIHLSIFSHIKCANIFILKLHYHILSDYRQFSCREQVIDFTKPFMNLGISILFKGRPGNISVKNEENVLPARMRY